MTGQVCRCLECSDILIGYTLYIDLIRSYYPGKEMRSTPMKQEIERCKMALEEAASGKTVSMICSGDAGVYGMAAPILELAEHYPLVTVEIVPGITAACSGAALLGAPLNHDFAVISLSDLMTPWETIARRLDAAAAADFAIAIYNPSSRKRSTYLAKACDILLRHRSPAAIVGITQQIGREGQSSRILTLSKLRETELSMFATVYIGNSQTKKIQNYMVTPRGYEIT